MLWAAPPITPHVTTATTAVTDPYPWPVPIPPVQTYTTTTLSPGYSWTETREVTPGRWEIRRNPRTTTTTNPEYTRITTSVLPSLIGSLTDIINRLGQPQTWSFANIQQMISPQMLAQQFGGYFNNLLNTHYQYIDQLAQRAQQYGPQFAPTNMVIDYGRDGRAINASGMFMGQQYQGQLNNVIPQLQFSNWLPYTGQSTQPSWLTSFQNPTQGLPFDFTSIYNSFINSLNTPPPPPPPPPPLLPPAVPPAPPVDPPTDDPLAGLGLGLDPALLASLGFSDEEIAQLLSTSTSSTTQTTQLVSTTTDDGGMSEQEIMDLINGLQNGI